MRASIVAAVTGAIVLAIVAPGARAAEEAACAKKESRGGDWPTYGHDYANTRHQSSEKLISAADAPLLSPAWAFSTTKSGGEGDITGTPIVAGGCLFVATNRGWVFALNADSGALVWKARLPKGGAANASVGVAERNSHKVRVKVKRRVRVKNNARGRKTCVRGKRTRAGKRPKRCYRVKSVWRRRWVTSPAVYVAGTRTRDAEGCPAGEPCIGPYVTAFDHATGKVEWSTPPLDTQKGADVFGSPIISDGVLMIGVSGGAAELGDEADRYAFQGSMSFLDVNSGRVLEKTWTVHPPEQPDDDLAGAGIWSTPAVDTEDKVAYVGSANPFRPQAEHEHANSVLKFDVDRRSKRFGEIVDSYKGNVDEYFPGLSQMPCYDVPGNPPPYYPQGIGSCGDIDLDFGAAPNLIDGPGGRKLVGAGQKSGVYHVFDAKTMDGVASQIVGPPSAVGGIVGSTAYDGESVFGPVTAPGYMWSVGASDASFRWAAPIADGAHWGPPVAVANGVVYSVDLTGFLDAFDARTGTLLAKRPLALGGSGAQSLSWGGVSVARNTIYASVGIGSLSEGFVVAFRPGGASALAGDVQETIGGLLGGGGGGGGGGGEPGGGGPSAGGSAVVAGPGAVYTTYATPIVTAPKGGPLSFVNLDPPQHDVTADDKGPDGRPVFWSRLGGLGEVVPVEGMDRVESGRSYGFFCSLHPGMRGTLVVR
jgi:polyvinyl alcohol dehydrogenase (cytochrome)